MKRILLKFSVLIWMLVVGLLLIPRLVSATTAVAMSVSDLVRHSDSVVVGRVESSEVRRLNGDRGQVYTYTTIRVAEDLKGGAAAGSTVVIRTLGGRIGNLMVAVPGMPSFKDGSESVVFLKASKIKGKSDRGAVPYGVVGAGQGKFEVAVGAGGRKTVSNPLVLLPSNDKSVPEGTAAMNSIDLDEFSVLVRGIVANQKTAADSK